MRCASALALLCLATTANAQPVASDEPTAGDVSTAPLPGQESGRLDAPEQDSALREIARVTLVVPLAAVEVAGAPIRGGLWMYDRYQLRDRFKQLFFDDTYTYGLYPTAVFDSSYGVTGGARFVHRDLFGEREHLALRGGFGGEFRARALGSLRSGRRFGDRVQAELAGEFERRPSDRFYGIGDATEPEPALHRQQLMRASATLDVRAVDSLFLGARGALTDLEYGVAEGAMPIDMIYAPSVLTGWSGVRNLYAELELRWDSRQHVTPLDHHAVFERGWLLAAYGGRIHQLEAGGDYWRYGADIQHFWRLGEGPHALAARFHVDAVSAEVERVPFTQLPQLGGVHSLRGYPRERYRDRIAVLGSLEYEWDLGRHVMASLFTDVGRVLPTWIEVQENVRVGYGVSLQLHDRGDFLAGITIASSIDGGLFIDFALDPVFDVEPRVEQR